MHRYINMEKEVHPGTSFMEPSVGIEVVLMLIRNVLQYDIESLPFEMLHLLLGINFYAFQVESGAIFARAPNNNIVPKTMQEPLK